MPLNCQRRDLNDEMSCSPLNEFILGTKKWSNVGKATNMSTNIILIYGNGECNIYVSSAFTHELETMRHKSPFFLNNIFCCMYIFGICGIYSHGILHIHKHVVMS